MGTSETFHATSMGSFNTSSAAAHRPTYVVAAARGLQAFILRSPRLRRMIGASELIDQITGNLLGQTLSSLALIEGQDYRVFNAVAGGVRLLFTRRLDAERFVAVWPLLVTRHAPGLEIVQGLATLAPGGTIDTVIEAAERAAGAHRNLVWPELPVAGLATTFCPQSGLPAQRYAAADREWLDAQALARERAVKDAREELLRRTVGHPEGWDEEDWERFPQDIGAIAGEERRYVALVHVDANEMAGRVVNFARRLRDLPPEEIANRFRDFAGAVEQGTRQAIREALRPILQAFPRPNVVPFRPVICAGDDFTALLQARFALRFVRELLHALPTAIANEFHRRFQDPELARLGRGVTASAGIVFAQATFPFATAYEVCESLGKLAKDTTARKVSALALRRLTTPTVSDPDEMIVSGADPESALRFTMNPYTVGPIPTDSQIAESLPRLADLEALVRSIAGPLRGPIRKLLLNPSPSAWQMEEGFRRLLEVWQHRGRLDALAPPNQISQELGTQAAGLVALLRRLTGNPEDATVFRTVRTPDRPASTPLYDAIQLLAVETVFES
ncbi:MAG: hypothetical protein JNK85_27070 [Verrucomicrobiales bacterium]|nr:hypothetical protein [Verrucomicrobiales bacterium]